MPLKPKTGGFLKKETRTASSFASETQNWGLGFTEPGKKPTGTVTSEELARNNAYYVRETEEKIIYLTFDAGYENGQMPTILDALKKHNVPAAFFVVTNYIEDNPELVKRMVEDGHLVGNHTTTHPDMSAIATKESFQNELSGVEAAYEKVTGQSMTKFYRPPRGVYSSENLAMAKEMGYYTFFWSLAYADWAAYEKVTGQSMTKFYRPPRGVYSSENLAMAKEMGYYTFFWSLAYADWYQDKQPAKEEAFQKLLGRIHPGAIVLLHSTSATNAAILDELLDKWKEMGYSFGTLEDFVTSAST